MSDRFCSLLIATRNSGKIVELAQMLKGSPVRLLELGDFPAMAEVQESGPTYRANAVLKARVYARHAGILAISDDSGLEVQALGGRPGVLSARYGGGEMAFPDKMDKLLAEILASEESGRRARFVCCIAVADPDGEVVAYGRGTCNGQIALTPRGDIGFGYDPIFIPDGYAETFGELDSGVKSAISHRARALSQIIPSLRHFIENQLDLG